ncbi:hypothetical protein TNCV_3695351 [Trichonephila clavipes]|nr:hypothetical protein TNCV_3695351 [Trichonephila clavipes]
MSPSIVMFYRPFGNFTELNRTVTYMVLKAKVNNWRKSIPLPRSDYVRQVENCVHLGKYSLRYRAPNESYFHSGHFDVVYDSVAL